MDYLTGRHIFYALVVVAAPNVVDEVAEAVAVVLLLVRQVVHGHGRHVALRQLGPWKRGVRERTALFL